MSMQLVFRVDSVDLGAGAPPVIKWSRDSRMVAFFGNTNQVFVHDRSGQRSATIPIQEPQLLDWNSEGKLLAISSNSTQIYLYSVSQRTVTPIEAPFVPTWISFSRGGNSLAAGSEKGKFWIYDETSQLGQTYQGTHCDRILEGVWNARGQLALCSLDRTVSISSIEGEMVARCEIDDTPGFPQFVSIKGDALVFASKERPVI